MAIVSLTEAFTEDVRKIVDILGNGNFCKASGMTNALKIIAKTTLC